MIEEDKTYQIIGKCMEVYNQLGAGFAEIVYKDALEYEFTESGIPFEREKRYEIQYKDIVLKHYFFADFIVFSDIILEVKCTTSIAKEHYAQCINYLKASGNKIALLINFGESSLVYKRIIY